MGAEEEGWVHRKRGGCIGIGWIAWERGGTIGREVGAWREGWGQREIGE